MSFLKDGSYVAYNFFKVEQKYLNQRDVPVMSDNVIYQYLVYF